MEGVQGSATAAAGALKDVAGAQVITKTLDKMNTVRSLSGPQIDADFQFRKDMLHAAGIGRQLDVEI